MNNLAVSLVRLPTVKVTESGAKPEVGSALNVGCGSSSGMTETVIDFVTGVSPPGPKHVRVNVVAAHMVAVASVPDVAFVPLQPPPALHHVAFVADQVRVVCWPGAMLVELAERETVGRSDAPVPAGSSGMTETVTDVVVGVRPPGPKQVSVKVVVPQRAAVASVPETALVPLQPPPALHHVAFVADQVRVVCWPGAMLAGLAEREITGRSDALPGGVQLAYGNDPESVPSVQVRSSEPIRWSLQAFPVAGACAL